MRSHPLEQALHLADPSLLGGNDRLQNRDELRADRVAQRIFGHADRPLMVRDHLSDEIGVEPVVGRGFPHLMEHCSQDGLHLSLVKADVLRLVLYEGALRVHALQGLDALRLGGDDVRGDVLQRDAGGVLQKVAGHFDCRAVVRDHLNNEAAGNAFGQPRLRHALDHFVKNLIIPA